jgi:hypothetical protein
MWQCHISVAHFHVGMQQEIAAAAAAKEVSLRGPTAARDLRRWRRQRREQIG